jgi:hypothetical protein
MSVPVQSLRRDLPQLPRIRPPDIPFQETRRVNNLNQVEALRQRGVVIPCSTAVEVGDDVALERIAPGVMIHAGCRLVGSSTSIGPGTVLGSESPVTLEDCQTGRNVTLKGGYFAGATFLDGASMGSSAHVRAGTLLEEQANGAHAVGLKQTIFLSFVTAGSLINFCDALMAGGTSRKNHSEIGSSYIHFNFTPHQDKATPSLIGDVPRGVMLDQEPIFLGGQGGLVGPVRINYGTVIPAGVICRQDILHENGLYAPAPTTAPAGSTRPFRVGAYRSIRRIIANNLNYLGNIHALRLWYELVRRASMTSDPFSHACHLGALNQIDRVLKERIVRLKDLAAKMQRSIEFATKDSGLTLAPELLVHQQTFASRWPELEAKLHEGPAQNVGVRERDQFLATWQGIAQGTPHLEAIGSLPANAKAAGTNWLNAVVDSIVSLYQNV